MKTKLLAGLIACLVPMVSMAGVYEPQPSGRVSVHVGVGSPPRGQPSQNGRYELRTVERWVEGFEDRVWVEQCFGHGHGRGHRRHRCQGHYETRWVPGHYESVEEWVFVPYRRPYRASGAGFEVRLSSVF